MDGWLSLSTIVWCTPPVPDRYRSVPVPVTANTTPPPAAVAGVCDSSHHRRQLYVCVYRDIQYNIVLAASRGWSANVQVYDVDLTTNSCGTTCRARGLRSGFDGFEPGAFIGFYTGRWGTRKSLGGTNAYMLDAGDDDHHVAPPGARCRRVDFGLHAMAAINEPSPGVCMPHPARGPPPRRPKPRRRAPPALSVRSGEFRAVVLATAAVLRLPFPGGGRRPHSGSLTFGPHALRPRRGCTKSKTIYGRPSL